MQLFRVFVAVTLVATVSVSMASAQSLRNAGEPAEFPPSSYTGKQYVDSKGCVYIRAGFSGNVTWVPRVSRSRQQVCGQNPTFAKAPVPEVPRVATVTPTPKPVPKPVVRAPVVRPAPKPTRIARPVAQVPAATTPAAPKSRRVVRRAAPVSTVAPKPTRTVAAAAPAQRVVRRVAPRKPPTGYRAAWTDGRLNPNRARGTAEGQAHMEMVWTSTVPRRLVSATTGRGATRRVAARNPVNENDSGPVVSTKTTARTPITVSGATHRFVQIGTYGQPANAKKVIARLRSLGLPVRVSKVQRNGKALQIVLAGPFKRQINLKAALSTARRAGYRDAMLRK